MTIWIVYSFGLPGTVLLRTVLYVFWCTAIHILAGYIHGSEIARAQGFSCAYWPFGCSL